MDWPADSVSRRKVSDLVPYARNARTHSDEQVAQIAASISEWGWTVPVLVDEAGGLIAGHGRVLAARKLKLAEIPVMVAKGWSEAQKRAYVLADNKLALNGGWDDEVLKVELADLEAEGFDIALTGFDPSELAEMGAAGASTTAGEASKSLAERFLIPPFSVLNAREGWWQDRKRAWLGIGIQSELGRGEQLIPNGGGKSRRVDEAGGGLRQDEGEGRRAGTLGAIAPNETAILKRRGTYSRG